MDKASRPGSWRERHGHSAARHVIRMHIAWMPDSDMGFRVPTEIDYWARSTRFAGTIHGFQVQPSDA
jgi:hypothetical protein